MTNTGRARCMSHRIITFERNGGYAARCEEPECGEITFGGFQTRTAASIALRGHEKTSETTSANEKTANELQLVAVMIPTDEGVIMSTVADTALDTTWATRRATAFSPITRADDPRLAELRAVLEEEQLDVDLDRVDAMTLGYLYGSWIFNRTVPKFEGKAPSWVDEATELSEIGIDNDTGFPVVAWVRKVVTSERIEATLVREEAMDPDSREIHVVEQLLAVHVIGHDEQLSFISPKHAREAAMSLLDAVDKWETLVGTDSDAE